MRSLLFGILFTLVAGEVYSQDTDSTSGAKDTIAVFSPVQVEASFPGGISGWMRYLYKNLNTKITKKCLRLPKRQKSIAQTVVVAFVVDKDGYVSDVTVENAATLCPLFVEEAIRVVSNGPRWIPGQQNGRNIISRKRQSITWVLED